MAIDKTALKKMIDAAKPNELLVTSSNALDKHDHKKIKSEMDKFVGKSGDYVLISIRK